MNITQILALAKQFDGDIPKLIEILNSPTLTTLAGLEHLEAVRGEIVAGLNFIKQVMDVLISLFPAS